MTQSWRRPKHLKISKRKKVRKVKPKIFMVGVKSEVTSGQGKEKICFLA